LIVDSPKKIDHVEKSVTYVRCEHLKKNRNHNGWRDLAKPLNSKFRVNSIYFVENCWKLVKLAIKRIHYYY